MSEHLGTDQALELLENLRQTVSDTAAREDKLTQEFHGRIGALHRRRDEAVEAERLRLESVTAQAEADFQRRNDAAEARHQKRAVRISRARHNVLQLVQQEIENRDGRGKYRLQSETLQSKRDQEQGLAKAEAEHQEYLRQLEADSQSLAALEEKARQWFRGYRGFARQGAASAKAEAEAGADERRLMEQFREVLAGTDAELNRYRRQPLPWLFRTPVAWVLILLCPAGLVPLLPHLSQATLTWPQAGGVAGGLAALGIALYAVTRGGTGSRVKRLGQAVARARKLHEACREAGAASHQRELARVENEYQARIRNMEEEWTRCEEEVNQLRAAWPAAMEEKAQRIQSRNEQGQARALEAIEGARAAALGKLRQEGEARLKELTDTSAERESRLRAEHQAKWEALESEWKSRIVPIYQVMADAQAKATALFPPWEPGRWGKWRPLGQFAHATRFAHLEADVRGLAGALPRDPRLALPSPDPVRVPLLLTYPGQGSVLFETRDTGQEEVVGALNNIILRLLSVAPPGRLNFTIIDPVGLGQNFAGVMHLADYEEHLINSRIWTQTTQIEEHLGELNEHMEKVIQMYLRNEYETIAEYNRQAGNIAEKYHFLVVANFPVNFSDTAARRLMSIATSGARCGVYTLIHWDQRQPKPGDFVPEELRKSSVCVSARGREFIFTGKHIPGTNLVLDPPPAPEFAIEFVNQVGRISIDSNRVEVPFAHVAPPEAQEWSLDTTAELRVPIGRTGATKLQYLAIGKDTRQHGLIAGKTGSGKSTLFHVAITNLALWGSPEQVEFYLVDFKKGVEFKCYATHRLPHARVVAIESDREFGLSVLQRVDEELKRRGEMFRKLGVQDIPGYKKAGGPEPVPRTLLIIDEFQEFFVEDDKISQTASVLLDRLVRQGRAFGIHVLLGSQTLGGAYTVARTTLGQMVIRIALQCNEADAYLIMDENNPAPRLLSRPGEGIYNDMAGMLEGNSPFQVVWLPDGVREGCLRKVRALADRKPGAYPGPLVYEGDAPGDVRENAALRGLLEASSIKQVHSPRIWLGAPNSIKGPTEAVFHRQSGNNLLIVGQREEAALAMLSTALVCLSAQYPRGGVRFILFDGTPPGSPQREFLERAVQAIPHEVTLVKPGELAGVMSGLAAEMKRRLDDEQAAEAPAVFLLIHSLQKHGRLRHEEDFSFSGGDTDKPANPAAALNDLVCEGTRLGFHVIATCDTYNNVSRFLSRKALSEFEMRVLFQMSASDSASLIDSPKAGNLGLHRALFYNEQEGHLETFRPYGLPPPDWLERAGRELARLLKTQP